MADNVTNELILDHLKRIQAKLTDHDDRFARLEAELRAIKGHMGALVQNDLTRDTDHASLLVRVERIERRLDLTEQ